MNDRKMTSIELRATWGLGAIFSLRMLGMFMVLPVLTTYGMMLQDANEIRIGIAIGSYGITQIIFQIPFGLLSDRIGRKPLIIGGLLIFTTGSLISAFTNSIWGIILGRCLQGSGAINAVVMALLSDLTREQSRTKAMACIGISFGLTFLIAMVIGPILTNAIGLKGLFGVITILSLIGVALTVFVIPTTNIRILNRETNIVSSSLSKILAHSQLMKLNIGIFCLHSILMLTFIALPLIMISACYLLRDQWKVYLITMLISFFLVIPAIKYAEEKHRMKFVLLCSIMLLLLAELILVVTNKYLVGILIGLQLFFLAFNIIETLLPSLISKESPVGHRGTAMGIYSTSQFLGVTFGGILGGFLLQMYAIWLVFLIGAVIALIFFLVNFTLFEPSYVNNLRIVLHDDKISNTKLVQLIKAQPGVKEVIFFAKEHSIYVKVDTKRTSRITLEKIIHSYS